jgi:hypothetical protein
MGKCPVDSEYYMNFPCWKCWNKSCPEYKLWSQLRKALESPVDVEALLKDEGVNALCVELLAELKECKICKKAGIYLCFATIEDLIKHAKVWHDKRSPLILEFLNESETYW